MTLSSVRVYFRTHKLRHGILNYRVYKVPSSCVVMILWKYIEVTCFASSGFILGHQFITQLNVERVSYQIALFYAHLRSLYSIFLVQTQMYELINLTCTLSVDLSLPSVTPRPCIRLYCHVRNTTSILWFCPQLLIYLRSILLWHSIILISKPYCNST
jgi:hypothetical protein